MRNNSSCLCEDYGRVHEDGSRTRIGGKMARNRCVLISSGPFRLRLIEFMQCCKLQRKSKQANRMICQKRPCICSSTAPAYCARARAMMRTMTIGKVISNVIAAAQKIARNNRSRGPRIRVETRDVGCNLLWSQFAITFFSFHRFRPSARQMAGKLVS